MTHIETWLLAIALAMDCFTVSLSCGIVQRRMGRQAWAMAFAFGFFQALMPLIGWSCAAIFSQYLDEIDHWIAFSLLVFLGGRMIWSGFHPDDEGCCFNPSKKRTILTLAIATSIDALAVGFSFIGMGMRTFTDTLYPLFAIGFVSFALSLAGKYIGVTLGKRFHLPAEQIGGIILIIIGIKVLVQHLIGA